MQPAPTDASHPLLQELMESFEAGSGMRMSFDDLTGMLNGAHTDVPAMRLDAGHQFHVCQYCQLAKKPDWGRDCTRNKVAVNRLVVRRKAGLDGICHLGLFDIAEPLIIRDRVLGVFYYGSVVVKGQEKRAILRVRRYCARMGYDPEPYLEALKTVHKIDPETIPQHRETLRTVARLARFFFDASGVRPDLYKVRALRYPYLDPQDVPYVVREAIAYISAHLQEPFIVKDLADHLNCHPDFLGRKFKQAMGTDLSLYLLQARIERAKRLLANPKISIEDAADLSGFSDRFHFSKAFRRLAGMPPGEFQRQCLQETAS
ncbi:MAG: helix-turn-helix domain-containing protein [Rariglobus sp.]